MSKPKTMWVVEDVFTGAVGVFEDETHAREVVTADSRYHDWCVTEVPLNDVQTIAKGVTRCQFGGCTGVAGLNGYCDECSQALRAEGVE